MPKDRRPSETEEIESIARMAREGRDFYEGLAKTLKPRESQAKAAPEPGDGTRREDQDQQK